MLQFLRISHLAVIDSLAIEFEPGFNALTGETGAGKSILVQAVDLLLGGRASGDLVRTGEEMATVEAIFVTGAEETVVRREVTAQGRSRAYVNGSLVTAGALKEQAGRFIELHGQHEHQTLLDPTTHLQALDDFGQLDELLSRTATAYSAWRTALGELAALRASLQERASQAELAGFQLAEIDRLAPQPDEDEELASTRVVLANAARIEALCTDGYAALYESDGAVLSVLSAVWKRVADLAALDPAFEPYLASRDTIKAQLEDLALFLRRYVSSLDLSPGRLQHVEERLAGLERLKRKFGPTLADVLERQRQLKARLRDLESGDEQLAVAERAATNQRAAFLAVASQLSQARRNAAAAFVPQMVDLLAGLALERARLEVRFNEATLTEAEWSATGLDRVEFYVSMNLGESPRPLARIVSGGELSRIMLALKTMTFRARLSTLGAEARVPGDAPPGMIFDEVDAGIGGRVAEAVGRRLRDLGGAFQILCITHLPQVAAQADTHFLIDKRVEGGRTMTRVTRLTLEQRVEEIAGMLAGSAVSQSVRLSAREMLIGNTRRAEAKGKHKAKGESESRPPAKSGRSRGA